MKKLLIIVLALLMVGITMADTGIPKVNEIQGLRTTTTVIAAGNFNAESSIDLTISEQTPITDLLGEREYFDAIVYQTVYTEDTQNSEVGYISYDKDLDLQTGNKVSGQYNVKAVKQITYLGVDASSVVTNDYLMLDGAAEADGDCGDRLICPFAGEDVDIPDFCNKVETGSAMNLKVANLNTQMGDRFIMKSSDPGVEIFNNVGVSSYAADLPSKGSVSAYIKGSIKEGGRDQDPFEESEHDLYETITFSDSTAISGDISTYAKSMLYTSVLDCMGED